jgi:hypothetical protein
MSLSTAELTFLQMGHNGSSVRINDSAVIKYHGGMMGGLKHGIGTLNYENGNLQYTGIWVQDFMDGKNISI